MRRQFVDRVSGATFIGEGFTGVVRDMRDAAWMVAPKRTYMREVAERILDMTARRRKPTVIRYRSGAQAFLEDLVEAGYLTETGYSLKGELGQ